MKRIDKLIFGLLFVTVFPILFFLLAILFWFYISHNESVVLYWVVSGLLAGFILAGINFKKMIQNAFDLPQRILVFIYIFYNICIYGFFMGFPVFNMVTGIVAGCYCGKKVVYEKVEANQIMHIGKKISSFTAFIVLLFCILSGIIAIIDGSIGGELEHMLGLGFKVTEGMVLSLILIGGLALIICQYYLTKMVFLKTTTFYLKKEYV